MGAGATEPDAKKKNYKNYGLDLTRGKVHDEVKAGVLEPSMSKIRSFVCIPDISIQAKLLTVVVEIGCGGVHLYHENRYYDQAGQGREGAAR